MKLYHFPYSPNARKAVMTARHLSIPVELVHVDLRKGEHRYPGYMTLHPGAQVPVLVDDDFVLTESHAIMAYLADLTAGQTLYPAGLRERAHVNQWLFWAANHWGPAIAGLTFENLRKKMFGLGEPDPAQVTRHEQSFRDLARQLDAALATRDWVTGQLSLADLAIAAPLMFLKPAKLPFEGFASAERWFGHVQKLEAWASTEPTW
ncbi:MAG: glutathione S-transferase family protein [Myxococcales bacterium]|nr:MAG: glutathione S-transferase family protein [Myxococcales bacterium]